MSYGIGIDIGGRNIKGVAITPAGRVRAQAQLPTGDIGRPNWPRRVRDLVRELRRRVGAEPAALGLGAPGLPAADGRTIAFMPQRFAGLEGFDWSNFLGGGRPVPVLNDAQAALLGECWRGAARGARQVLLLTLGTGVGGAAMVDGHLLRGHLGRAGHLGHVSLDPAGPPDITGTPGSLEDAVGDATVAARSGGRFTRTHDLLAAVARGDAAARRVWADSVRALAAGLAGLINVLDPAVVIIGGGITRAGPALFRPLRRGLDRFEWRPGGARVRLVCARLGDRAGAYGAAWAGLRAAGLVPA